MLLSRATALSILSVLGAQGLVIPGAKDIITVFNSDGDDKLAPKKGLAGIEKKVKGNVQKAAEKMKQELLPGGQMAPLVAHREGAAREDIPHRYIVVMKKGISLEQMQFHQEWVALQHMNSVEALKEDDPFLQSLKKENLEGGITHSFDIDNVMMGYAGAFNQVTMEMVRRSPLVDYVERDSVVHASEFDIEKGAPWGLARVSHRDPLNLSSFNKYLYDDDGGKGVTAYVIDTGINVNHNSFGGRAAWGSTIPEGDSDTDGNGHGTHCAGTIASLLYGVAKEAEVVAVKVLRSNGSGSMSDVVKGVEFAAKSHIQATKLNKKGFKGSTANMSLGGGQSPALDQAVNAAVRVGINFAVAAGNENQDACNTSPARAGGPITVGASSIADERAYFSNYGECVDIFGPGVNILSTYIGSDDSTATLSGTSMASPHICGLLSYFLSLQPSSDSAFAAAGASVTPEQLKKNLVKFGTRNILSDVPSGTPNILAYNGAGQNLSSFWNLDAQEKSAPCPMEEEREAKLGAKLEELFAKLKDHSKSDSVLDETVDSLYHVQA